ncbi:MAG TPA: dienelactone hydrolase family protein [Polyangiaceae bacterium]|nr:dienelactone hydrolase family protein [Polyangiaceae bacterium]
MQTESLALGYLAIPDGGGPGLVLIHDVWGLSDHQRDFARRFAADGFLTLAIDLYRPLGHPRVSDPGPFMRELSDPDVLRTVQSGVDLVRSRPELRGKVGIVGFCMGGTYALFSGAMVNGISAIAPFYGVLSHRHGLYYSEQGLDPLKKPREPVRAAADLRVPMLACFGAEDQFIPLSDVKELEQTVAGKPDVEIHVYPGAGHAFANDTRPQMYRPEAARDAYAKAVTFLRRHLEAPR